MASVGDVTLKVDVDNGGLIQIVETALAVGALSAAIEGMRGTKELLGISTVEVIAAADALNEKLSGKIQEKLKVNSKT